MTGSRTRFYVLQSIVEEWSHNHIAYSKSTVNLSELFPIYISTVLNIDTTLSITVIAMLYFNVIVML